MARVSRPQSSPAYGCMLTASMGKSGLSLLTKSQPLSVPPPTSSCGSTDFAAVWNARYQGSKSLARRKPPHGSTPSTLAASGACESALGEMKRSGRVQLLLEPVVRVRLVVEGGYL